MHREIVETFGAIPPNDMYQDGFETFGAIPPNDMYQDGFETFGAIPPNDMYQDGLETFGAIPQNDMYQNGFEPFGTIPQNDMYQNGSETRGPGTVRPRDQSYEDLVQAAVSGSDAGGRAVFTESLETTEPEGEPQAVEAAFVILQKTGTDDVVSRTQRPLSKFGDGLSLRASSRVTLRTAALGEVSFFVLDGEPSPDTPGGDDPGFDWQPVLEGSQGQHQLRAFVHVVS